MNPYQNSNIFYFLNFFFKNEASNQKSETVKLLGYVWTCSGDNIGLRKLILRMPRPYSEAHEKACFQELLKRPLQKLASHGQKFDFQNVL